MTVRRPQTTMSKWRCPALAIVALWALLASALPSLSWACPLTGRIGDAHMVCAVVMPQADSSSQSSKPCAHLGGKCCKQIPVPPLPNSNGDKSTQATYTVGSADGLVAVFSHSAGIGHSFVIPLHVLIALLPLGGTTRPTASPPSFFTQHRPASIAGRAPPTA